jgi:hypothetical protein
VTELKIKTIRDLAKWKYARKAQALAALADGES